MSKSIYLLSPTPRDESISMPMIKFSINANSLNLSYCDTLMFTSKQAVVTANAIDENWKKYPCIAIGSATKKQIESLGAKVIYHPKEFYGKNLSADIAEFFKDRKILYLRPKEISFDSKGFLKKEGIELQEQIIYETSCIEYKDEKKPKKDSIIIFTSPSTIHCFLKNFNWDESYIAIVIGNSTKVHLPKNANFFVADEPTIDACLKKSKDIYYSLTPSRL